MVDPNHIRIVEGDCITAPDILRVQVRDSDVSVIVLAIFCIIKGQKTVLLDDDIACAADNPKTLAFDHTTGSFTHEAFVGFDSDTQHAGVVTVTLVS